MLMKLTPVATLYCMIFILCQERPQGLHLLLVGWQYNNKEKKYSHKSSSETYQRKTVATLAIAVGSTGQP